MEIKHVPVMLEECMENLNLKSGGVYFDATLGAGGHSGEILKRAKGFDSRFHRPRYVSHK